MKRLQRMRTLQMAGAVHASVFDHSNFKRGLTPRASFYRNRAPFSSRGTSRARHKVLPPFQARSAPIPRPPREEKLAYPVSQKPPPVRKPPPEDRRPPPNPPERRDGLPPPNTTGPRGRMSGPGPGRRLLCWRLSSPQNVSLASEPSRRSRSIIEIRTPSRNRESDCAYLRLLNSLATEPSSFSR